MTTLFEFAPTGTIVDGAAVPPNSAVYDAVDAGVVYDTAVTFKDLAASAEAPNAAGTTFRTLEQQLPALVATRRLVRVMQVDAFTAGSFTTLTRWRNGSTSQGEVRITSAGKVVLRDAVANTALATSTPSVPFGEPFRFELAIVEQAGATADQLTLRLYLDAEALRPDVTMGPFSYSGGPFDRIVDGLGTAAAATTVHVLYAADGDTENPSLSRWATPPSDGGMQRYLVTPAGEVLITSKTI